MRRLFYSAIILSLACSTAAAHYRGQNQGDGPRPDSITGRVINDSGQPVAGAIVSATSRTRMRFENQSTRTDEAGNFRFDGLAYNLYSISAHAAGYTMANLPDNSIAGRGRYRPGDTVSITLTRGGVITGTVTNSEGNPVVAITINIIRVRDERGRTIRYEATTNRPVMTDDRGVYRAYAVQPGTYIVLAGRRRDYISTAYDDDAPTYYPSSTIDTASEVVVRNGEEAQGIDIRYRGKKGHIVSGQIIPAAQASMGRAFLVDLISVSKGFTELQTYIDLSPSNSFALRGVPDGEYFLIARQVGQEEGAGAVSQAIRVKVKDADVTGLKVAVTPFASISGRLVVETIPVAQKEKCENKQPGSFEDAIILVRPGQTDEAKQSGTATLALYQPAIPDVKGGFIIHHLEAGQYYITPRLDNNNWYIRAITMAETADKPPVDVTQSGLHIKAGARVTGVTVTIAEGAAAVRGNIIQTGGASATGRFKVHFVPVEVAYAKDLLRYRETFAQADGTFAVANLAPGRYWIIARPASDEDEGRQPPVAQDSSSRQALRREAEAANVVLELQPCQRIGDYHLRYAPGVSKPGEKEKSETRDRDKQFQISF